MNVLLEWNLFVCNGLAIFRTVIHLAQTHQSLLQKYDENQWINFWIGTLIFLLSGHKPENLIWLSKLAMQLNLIIQRKIRSQRFFSVTALILENATIAAKDVKVS